jgi:hypothetical protein
MKLEDIYNQLQSIRRMPSDEQVGRVYELFRDEKDAALNGLKWQFLKLFGIVIVLIGVTMFLFWLFFPCV